MSPWKSLFFPLAVAESSIINMVPILLHSPPHTHTHDLLDICSEESKDVGVGKKIHIS